jgi:hypothetical protein
MGIDEALTSAMLFIFETGRFVCRNRFDAQPFPAGFLK